MKTGLHTCSRSTRPPTHISRSIPSTFQSHFTPSQWHKRPVHLQCLQLLSFIINIFMDELTLGNYSYMTWLVTSLPVVKLSLSSLMLPVRSQAFSISHTFFIRLDLGKQTWVHREIDIKLWESSMCFLPCMHSLLRTSTYQCEPWLWSMSLGGVGLYPLRSIVLSGAHL